MPGVLISGSGRSLTVEGSHEQSQPESLTAFYPVKKRCLILALLGASLLTLIQSCSKGTDYVIIRSPGLARFTNDFEGRITSTLQFLHEFVRGDSAVVSNVHPEFRGNFPLFQTNFEARVWFSAMAESCIYVAP